MKKQKAQNPNPPKNPTAAVKSFVTKESFHTDPAGSYTGRPKEPGEQPEQDSDDL